MDFSALNVFDVVIITLVLLSTIFAFVRGFIRTIFSLLCWTLSVVFSVMLAPYAIRYLENHMDSVWAVLLISYIGAFVLIFTLFAILFSFIVSLARPCCDGFIDRSLGAALGFVRGAIIACLIFSGVTWGLEVISNNRDNPEYRGPGWIANAQSYNFLNISSDFFASALPEGFRVGLSKGFTRMGNLAASMVDSSAAPGGVPAISAESQQTLINIVAILPDEYTDRLDTQFGPVTSRMREPDEIVERRAEVLLAYEEAAAKGEIIDENLLPANNVAILRSEILAQAEALQAIEREKMHNTIKDQQDAEDPAAYSAEKIKMMDRLLDQFR